MEQILTEEQRVYLKQKHRRERNAIVRDRIKAVLAYDEGYSYSDIARLLLLDDETIRRYINDYLKKHKLNSAHKGSQPKLDKDQTQALCEHLLEHTYLYVKDVCAYVKKAFDITYSVSGMTHWLKAQGFRYKKPHGVPAKADVAKQADFVETYNSLKKGLKPEEIICFADSSHPQHQTKLAYGWIKKGVRKSEKMTSCLKRLNIIGAIDLSAHDVTYQSVDWVNAESIKAFLKQLMVKYSDKKVIHLIWDNAGYHKSKDVQNFIAQTNIKVHYLPPYSPNLNPIERLWKVMHEHTTYNRYYEKFKDFTEGILRFFENIGEYRSTIQSRITDNFQRLTQA
jgi:transposase